MNKIDDKDLLIAINIIKKACDISDKNLSLYKRTIHWEMKSFLEKHGIKTDNNI